MAVEATAPTLPFTVGTPVPGIVTLQPNTRYYVNVVTIEDTSDVVNLDASLEKPRGL